MKLLILLGSIASPLVAAETWQTNTNPRFGIRIEMPAHLKPQTTAPNGSLHSFTDGRFTLTIHGHFLHDNTLAVHWKKPSPTTAKRSPTKSSATPGS